MTPAARISAAIEVLDHWLGGAPIERALTNWARGARYAGSKDRAAVRDHVFDILRRKNSCAAVGGGSDGRALAIGHIRLQGFDLDSIFSGEGHAPAPLSDQERFVPSVDKDIWRDVPIWLHSYFSRALGETAELALMGMSARAPLYLRVNTLRSNPDDVQTSLLSEAIETTQIRDTGALEVIENPRKFRLSRAYQDGHAEIQDLSAQLATSAVAWPQTGRILDYCAGGGGKTLGIAAMTSAELFAHDANPARMKDLPVRAKRAGAKTTLVVDPNGGMTYDAVLCDVPCSGSGTWRRDPEAKWRLTPDSLEKILISQSDILKSAAKLVRPGGQLVYMTCSYFCEENVDQIDQFLSTHSGWTLHQQVVFGIDHGSDGFFLAELRRGV